MTAIGSAPVGAIGAQAGSAGATITGMTMHGAQRMAERGVGMRTVQRVVSNADRIVRLVGEGGRISWQYIKGATSIVLNAAGKVVTVWGPQTKLGD